MTTLTADATDRPGITVVVPAYNAERTIGGTLASILTQGYEPLDVVVVDDGSTDATRTVVEGYVRAGLPVTLISQENAGVSAARNVGIRAARSPLVALLDADDEMLPTYLEKALAAHASGGPRSWVTVNGYLLTAGGFDPRRKVMYLPTPDDAGQVRAILEGNFAPSFTLFPKAMTDEIGDFDEALTGSEDWDLWARAIMSGWKVVVVREPLAFYRWVAGSLSSQHEGMWDGEEQMLAGLRRRFGDRLSADDRAYLDERIAAGSLMRILRAADDALRTGDAAAARSGYRTVARLAPSDRRSRVKAMTLGNPVGDRFWRRRLLAADRATRRDEVPR